MAKYSNKSLDDLDITKSELKSLGEALKQEDFRKLLSEYVEEVNDPQNRAIYEKEITELEKQRGVSITFIHPQPGYVIKSSVDGVQKVFINICSNGNIDKPVATKRVKDGVQGSNWTLPHILTPPKVDLDKKGQRCVVYDVVFHPLSLEIAKNNINFKSLVNDTAISGIEDSFNARIDRNNIKFPKMDFKGPKMASVIRKKCEDILTSNEPPMEIPNYPYEPLKPNQSPKVTNVRRIVPESQSYTTPQFIIKHRKGIDLQEFTNLHDSKMNSTVPTEIVIEIDLPLLSSAGDAVLDVSSKTLSLISEKPSKYKLELNLPYQVDDSSGSARFDKKTKKLVVNLPTVQKKIDSSYLSRYDSGIESDPCQNRSSSDEDLSNSKVEVLSSCDIIRECSGSLNTLRTSNNKCGEFLSENLYYSFPSFNIVHSNNTLTVTVNVKNIEPSSVSHLYVFSGSGVHFKFSSLGAGCYPIYYALCLNFPGFIINTPTLKVEVWDNNIIIYIEVNSKDGSVIKTCLVGPTTDALLSKDIFETEIEYNESNKLENIEEVNDKLAKLLIEENSGELNSKSENPALVALNTEYNKSNQGSEEYNNKEKENTAYCHPHKKQPKVRTSSESNVHPPSSTLSRRSILKTSRSLSESHSDEYNTWSSLDSSDITEDSSPGSSVKKTVRFSDVISKRIFRANSSILGQKHKNEKKSRNRKKVARRRISESENSEVSDFSDYSEVSDISDVSETSDASSDDQPNAPAQLPSGKHHRRRGSKNSRKNAATSKQNSFILSHD